MITKEIPVFTYQHQLPHNEEFIWIATSYTTVPNATLVIEVEEDYDEDSIS